MPTNKEWLYSLDPHALTEWFESEHFECPTNGGEASMMSVDAFIAEHTYNDTLAAKKVVSVHTGTANDANVSEHVENQNGTLDGARAALDAKIDSRAKLEADVNQYVMQQVNSTITWEVANEIKAVVIALLDRQAAISEANVERKWSCYEGSVQAEIDRLENRIFDHQNRIAELREQVDDLRSDLHAARSDAEYYRGKLGDVLDCVCEALRVGTLDVSLVDRNGEVVS